MTARYLVRLDDACPTMAHDHWHRLEALLYEYGVRPIVAVVPDNRDPSLVVDEPAPAFWDRVRGWQSKGWTIAMHGYRHVFHSVSRKRLVLPFYDRSEFAGLSYEAQAEKLQQSWALLVAQGIEPTVWVAPAHGFDRVTLEALRDETPIRRVSDGIARDLYWQHGFFWLPQQLWQFQRRRAGLWTVCLHPNSMDARQLDALRAVLADGWFRERIVAVQDLAMKPRRRDLLDWGYAHYFWSRGAVVPPLLRLRARLRGGPSCH